MGAKRILHFIMFKSLLATTMHFLILVNEYQDMVDKEKFLEFFFLFLCGI